MKRLRLIPAPLLLAALACDGPTGPRPDLPWAMVSAGEVHTCAVDAASAVFCWGRGLGGNLATGDIEPRLAPHPIVGGFRFRAVSAGDGHTCAISTDPRAYCWGGGGSYETGTGWREGSRLPAVVTGGAGMTAIAAGDDFTCGLDAAGRALCWGSNAFGQLGSPDTVDTRFPRFVQADGPFDTIAAGAAHGCALDRDGAALCWGRDDHGQLGAGPSTGLCAGVPCSAAPRPVTGDHRFRAVSAGQTHSCGIDLDGAAYCWGDGRDGQLGDGAGESSPAPVRVAGGPYHQISAGDGFTCAVAGDGRGLCWGRNAHGRLGVGPGVERADAPLEVAAAIRFRQLSTGRIHACGVGVDGSLHCWGYGGLGALGHGGVHSSPYPHPVRQSEK